MSEKQGAEARESRECTDALDDEGYVLALATTGKVAKCAAGGSAYGVNYKSTKHQVTGVAEANKQVAIVNGNKKAYVQFAIASTDSDVDIGDLVGMTGANAAGCVKQQTAADRTLVGVALEAHAAPGAGTDTGKILVRLMCPYA